MAFSVIYDLFLGFYFLIQIPFLLRRVSSKSKNWKGLKARLLGPWPEYHESKSIWIHAVSLGESKAILPIIKEFQAQEPKRRIICTVQSDTGFEFLSKVSGIEVVYMPLDLSWIQRSFIKRINPKLLVLSEGDFWYHQLQYAKKAGARIILLSGKLSERSMKIYKCIPWISRRVFDIDAIGVQNQLHYNRFSQILSRDSNLFITGNLKYIQQPIHSFETSKLKQLIGLQEDDLGITIASTHECEEAELLNMIQAILGKTPQAKLFIAPRHPSRFLSFYKRLSERFQHNAVLFSDLGSNSNKIGYKEGRVCLVDQMGILSDLFKISKVAIVAGSFDPSIGGHNLLEPIQAGCPVIFGPHTQNQIEFKELILKNQAGWELFLTEIPALVGKIQANDPEYFQVLKNGSKLMREQTETKNRSWQLIEEYGSPRVRLRVL